MKVQVNVDVGALSDAVETGSALERGQLAMSRNLAPGWRADTAAKVCLSLGDGTGRG